MNRTLRITGLLFASLTISTVALAQQGGGGRGGDGGSGGDAGSSDNSVISLRLQDHERARLSRAVTRRGGHDCIAYGCNEPPNRMPPARFDAQLPERCGGEVIVRRDRTGRIDRYRCDRF